MMRRLTSSPKPASRVAAMTSSTVPPGTFDTHAEAHGVELRQVAGGLRGEDQVVRRDAVLEVRRADLHDLGTLRLHRRQGGAERRRDAGLEAAVRQLLDDADTKAPQHVAARALTGGLGEGGPRIGEGRGIARVMPADDVVEQPGVEDAAGHRPHLVEAGCQCDGAVAADAAVRGLDADGPA